MKDKKKNKIKSVIKKAVQKRNNCRPLFYVVGGSHIYGFPSDEGGDYDVRGFHLDDWRKYASLNEPEEQIIVNQGGITDGFASVPDIELVSYELKKFGKLVSGLNFNVIEWVLHGEQIINGCPLALNSLKNLIRINLPSDVPRHYKGMAKHNYKKYLNPERDAYKPTAKKYLYVLRGLLGAKYVIENENIVADIREMCSNNTIEKLIEVKKEKEDKEISSELKEESEELIVELFDEIDVSGYNRVDIREALNNWMKGIRIDYKEGN